jgi:DNA-binding CsgD family transcriptional regulator/ligand-binding sensor protein
MKIKQLQKLQSLQDAYASLSGLTIMITDLGGNRLTAPSNVMDIVRLILEDRGLFNNIIFNIVDKISDIHKPIVYESFGGFKLLAAPVRMKEQTLFFVLAGLLVDKHSIDLVAAKLYDNVPGQEWDAWSCALYNTPLYNPDHIEVPLNQLEDLAEVIETLLEREKMGKEHTSRLQLLNLPGLVERHDPSWLQNVLEVFIRVTELEFAGFAHKTKGEQYTVTQTIGFKGEVSLRGATFFTGEGYLGQVALTRQMGYWEKPARDPRVTFFTTRGIEPQVIICYPLIFQNEMFGLLIGGHSSIQVLSEAATDMGALLARQMAAELYGLKSEEGSERRRYRNEALQEMIQGVLDIKEKDHFFQVAIEMLQQTVHVPFVGVVLKKSGKEGMQMYASGTRSIELLPVYAENAAIHYFGDGREGLNMFRKPARREWNELEMLELPLVYGKMLLGVMGVHLESSTTEQKEIMPFLHVLIALMVIKLQLVTIDMSLANTSGLIREARSPMSGENRRDHTGRKSYTSPAKVVEKAQSMPVGNGSFTPREEEVLYQVMQGLNNFEIAQKLFISEHTVKNHITKVYKKLEVNDRAQAIAKMYRTTSPNNHNHL